MNLTNLQSLLINYANKLSGPLPAGLFCFSELLRSIELYDCSFNGSISSGFGSGCDNDVLEHLNVSNNRIKGEFDIGSYNLEIVDISNNFITNITNFGSTRRSQYSKHKSIYAQNNSISRFPSEFFEYKNLQDIYLDLNNISSIAQKNSKFNASTIQRISMSKNKFQAFPEDLLQLPNLEEIILDSNNITGELYLPNILCQHSKIKLISLLYNNITHIYPSNNTTSCFSDSSILLDTQVFLFKNPICTKQSHNTKLLRSICRVNATSPIEAEEIIIVKKSTKILRIIVACTSSVVVILFIIGFFVIQKLKKNISLLHEIQSEFDKRDVKPNLYSFSELKVATQDFHIRNELGRGGFGIVYKACQGVLPDGSHVAVKKLTKLSMEQGIQDFLKNKNLVDALWGDSRSDVHLDWPTRFNIILGIARGLAYLHEDVQPIIVHRDIKGENILLDKHFNPKIVDFGLALFFPSFDDGETHMSVSKVAGTKGYMAPEYLCYGQVSTKLDVFSFGMLLLEIVSGRKKIDLKLPSTEQYLVHWAQELHSNDNLPNLKDKSLEEMTMAEEATFKQVVKVGLHCLHYVAARHPMMSKVVAMLIGNKNVDEWCFGRLS